MATSKRMGVFMASIMAIIWGLSFLSIKTAVVVVPPMSLGLARFILACAVLLLILVASRRFPHLAMRDLPLMAISGLVGVTLYFLGENNGVLRLSASEASIIIGTIPVLTMLAERLFTKARLTGRQYLGALLSALGVSLIVVESLRLSPAPLGYLFMLIAALSWVAYAFLTKPLLARYDSLVISFWQNAFGALGFIPFVLTEHVQWTAITPVVAANVLYLGIFCSAVGYLFYVISLRVLGPSVSSVFINLIPVVSVAASFVILGERLSTLQLAGGAVTIGGVYLASRADGRKKVRRNADPPEASISV
jgi:drug/metabolite transporter (DMT)-like permease